MLLVVDANIVLSALVAGNLSDMIFSPLLELVAPELLFKEVRKNKAELIAKSCFTEPEIETLLKLLETRIKTIPLNEFVSFLPEAEKMLGEHKKDAPYLALALKLKCPVWSYENLFKTIGEIESLTTEEVKERLEQARLSLLNKHRF